MLKRKSLSADLCVVGGGMAGICAAVAAARQGIKVVLMHERAVLGGNASSEIRMWVCGARGTNNRETGIIEEIMLENLYRNPTKNYYIWDTVLYDFVIREENITLLLNCTCMDSETESGSFSDGRDTKIRRITGYQLTTQTFFDVEAKFYSDCSGDSILAPLTGAHFKIGRECSSDYGEATHVEHPDNFTMGMSCLLQGRQTDKKIPFKAPEWSAKIKDNEVERRGTDIYNTLENFWYLELGGNRNTIDDTEEITRDLMKLSVGMWDYIKNSGKMDADNWELEFLGFLPGKRESRRMTGEYVITQKDISENVIFDDTAAYGGWPLDDHFPLGFYHDGVPNTDFKTPAPYPLPYRALYSKNVENLFFAGRNISMTHMAMSSIRVMATCALLGQAVGTAAAIAAKYGLTPHGVYLKKTDELQQALMNSDCFLPYKKRNISSDCVKNAPYAELCDGMDRPNRTYGTESCGIFAKNGAEIKYSSEQCFYAEAVHIVFDSDLNRETLNGDFCERTHATRCNILLDSPFMDMPKTLCKEFILTVTTEDGSESITHITENRKRGYDIQIGKKVRSVSLIPVSNWGNTAETAIFSFDFR